jgi:hypothetical protein
MLPLSINTKAFAMGSYTIHRDINYQRNLTNILIRVSIHINLSVEKIDLLL